MLIHRRFGRYFFEYGVNFNPCVESQLLKYYKSDVSRQRTAERRGAFGLFPGSLSANGLFIAHAALAVAKVIYFGEKWLFGSRKVRKSCFWGGWDVLEGVLIGQRRVPERRELFS